jgi:hypothetical protein
MIPFSMIYLIQDIGILLIIKIDILAEKGPRRDLSIKKGPKDGYYRRFSALFYTRFLSNGEHHDRDWLVYSKELDRVFCLGCKLFTKGQQKG